jgi:DNA-binding PadR family transcriptional regulator
MEKPTTKLSAQDRVILFCVATGINNGSVGIIDHAMQSMAIRGFIAHNRESGVYALTDSGRATLTAILEDAEIGIAPK